MDHQPQPQAPPAPSMVVERMVLPSEWFCHSSQVQHTARILSLWERTVELIAWEQYLSADEQKYLAEIEDHKVCGQPAEIYLAEGSS